MVAHHVKHGLILHRSFLPEKMAAPREVPLEQSEGQRIAGDQLETSKVALELRHARDATHHLDGQLAGWYRLERAGIIQM